jgi:hypothetical protein
MRSQCLELVAMHPRPERAVLLFVDEEAIPLECRVHGGPANDAGQQEFHASTGCEATRALQHANGRERRTQQRQRIVSLVEGEDDVDRGLYNDLPYERGHIR